MLHFCRDKSNTRRTIFLIRSWILQDRVGCYSAVSSASDRRTGDRKSPVLMQILPPEPGHCTSWISGRERMIIENISWSISTRECCRTRRGRTRNLLITSRTCIRHRGQQYTIPVYLYFKMSFVDFCYDCATALCNYYFCKHLMKYCRGESYYDTFFSKKTRYCISDQLSASSQSDDSSPHTSCCTPVQGSSYPR